MLPCQDCCSLWEVRKKKMCENTSMKQVTLTGNPHTLCAVSELPPPWQVWDPWPGWGLHHSTSDTECQGGTLVPGLWDWHWSEPHPLSQDSIVQLGCSGINELQVSGWELWGRAEVLLGGMCVFNCGEQDRAFSLPKRTLQKFEMCRWHRICERTFVSWWKPLFRSSQLLFNH